MKIFTLGVMLLSSLTLFAADLERCGNREHPGAGIVSGEELNSFFPKYKSEAELILDRNQDSKGEFCISKIEKTTFIKTEKLQTRSFEGCFLKNKYALTDYVVEFPNGYKCIDTMATRYSSKGVSKDWSCRALKVIISPPRLQERWPVL
jgi:hypothetical protein